MTAFPGSPGAVAAPRASKPAGDVDQATIRVGLALAAILVIGLLLRLPQLGESVWYDELWSTHIRLYTLGELVRVSLKDVHPPAYQFFMFLWIRLFGDSEISIRLPPLIFGLGTIALIFQIARAVFPLGIALLAAFLLAVSPAHIWYSQEARAYSLVAFLSLLAVHAQLQLLGRDKPGRWWSMVYAAAVGIGVLTHYYVVALVAVLALVALLHGGQRGRRLLAIDVGAVLCLAALLFTKRTLGTFATEASYLTALTPVGMSRLFLDWFVHGNTMFRGEAWRAWPALVLPWAVRLAVVMLVVLGIRHLFRHSGRRTLEILGYILAVPALLLALGFTGFGRSYIQRSALASLPFYLVLLAAGIASLASRAPPRMRNFVIASAGVLALLPALALTFRTETSSVYKPNPGWSAAAVYLAIRRDTQPLLVFATSPATSLIYYGIPFSERHADFYPVVDMPPARAAGPDTTQRLGRIRRRLDELTAFGSSKDLPPAFRRGGPDELIYLGKAPDSIIAGVLRRTGRTRFFLVRNAFWLKGYDRLLGGLAGSPHYTMVDTASFRGLTITEVRVAGKF